MATVAQGTAGATWSLTIGALESTRPCPARIWVVPSGVEVVVAGEACQVAAAVQSRARLDWLCLRGPMPLWLPQLQGSLVDAGAAWLKRELALPHLVVTDRVGRDGLVELTMSDRGSATAVARLWAGPDGGGAYQVCALTCSATAVSRTAPFCAANLAAAGVTTAPPARPMSAALGWTLAHAELVTVAFAVVALVAVAQILRRRPVA